MTTRADVIKEIEAVDARVHELTPQLLTHGNARLPEADWRVREALCHLAARANGVPVATAAAQRARARAPGESTAARGAVEIDEVNRRQIDDRRDRSLQELLEEIHSGHQNAIRAVREFDEQTLGEHLVLFAGRSEMSFAELLRLAGPAHENNHLDQIVKAIGG
jgi:hypothetical protein